jgi:COP9 signalosome complex subunit 3
LSPFLPIQRFDPARDSILYLFILRLQIQTAYENTGETIPIELQPSNLLWTRSADFLRNFDRIQVRYVGREWRELIEIVGHASRAVSKVSWFLSFLQVRLLMVSQPILATRLIRDAMLRLDPSCAVFTSTHLLLVRLCLQANAYSCALPILDKHICHLPIVPGRPLSDPPVLCTEHDSSITFVTDASGLSSKISYRDHLQYFLYGGMVYMALKDWRKALHFLGVVISTPIVSSVSLVMVEAYKKWVLVGLLEYGKVRRLSIKPPLSSDFPFIILLNSLWEPVAPTSDYHNPACGENISVTSETLCYTCTYF